MAFHDGQPAANPVPFRTGLVPDPADANVNGRPVGLAVAPDGSLLVSDDAAALIARVRIAPKFGRAAESVTCRTMRGDPGRTVLRRMLLVLLMFMVVLNRGF